MIAVSNKVKLLKTLQTTFPGTPIRSDVKDNASANFVAVTVNEINLGQLDNIKTIAQEIGAAVKLKRSGTGVSVHFN